MLQDIENGSAVPERGKRVTSGLFPQGFLCGDQLRLQVKNTPAGTQTHFKFVYIEGLHDVVIGAGAHALDDVFS